MCQGYEGEKRSMARGELAEIREAWRRHQSGEAPLSDDEIRRLAIRKMMLEEI